MDDSFAFQGTRDPRRLHPRVLKLGLAGSALLLVTLVLGAWAVSSERTSFHRMEEANALASRQTVLQNRQLAVAEAATQTVAVAATVDPSVAALQAQHEAFAALRAAKALHRSTGTFTAAGPAELTASTAGRVFVDGPSIEPQVVSVSTSKTAWAAAVMSSEGICYYVRVAPTDAIRYGTGVACTGAAAMRASGGRW
ncbi:MAG: hypothetical protein QOG88_28 [Actinomycetota bacterium]|nr:hypothetical protein [Actinomycetota bacterium]